MAGEMRRKSVAMNSKMTGRIRKDRGNERRIRITKKITAATRKSKANIVSVAVEVEQTRWQFQRPKPSLFNHFGVARPISVNNAATLVIIVVPIKIVDSLNLIIMYRQ